MRRKIVIKLKERSNIYREWWEGKAKDQIIIQPFKNGPPKKQKLKKRVADFGTVIF